MTPQEKAKELVKKYYNYVSGWTSTNTPTEKPIAQYEGEEMKIGRAKQCALITVDELINATQYEAHIQMAFNPCETTEYWLEVKAFLHP